MEFTRHLFFQTTLSQLSDQVGGFSTRPIIDVREDHGVALNHHLHDSCIAVLKGVHTVDIFVDNNSY